MKCLKRLYMLLFKQEPKIKVYESGSANTSLVITDVLQPTFSTCYSTC